MSNPTVQLLTLGEVADAIGIQAWKIRAAIDRGLLPAPQKVGRYHVLPADQLEEVRRVMTEAGYVKAPAGGKK